MRCGDLDRYLEAYLDGRLGRTRSAGLQRHLGQCGACQARVERLRQFERDTQRRCRPLGHLRSVWEGLELDLVGDCGVAAGGQRLPPARTVPVAHADPVERDPDLLPRAPGHPLVGSRRYGRGGASRLAGLLLIAMAVGALYELGPALPGSTAGGDATDAYLRFAQAAQAPDLPSADADAASAWLAARLGQAVPVPLPPEGYTLVGAAQASLAGAIAGAAVYADDAAEADDLVMVFVRPEPDPIGAPAAPDLLAGHDAASGLREVSWQAHDLRYTVVGPRSERDLQQFVRSDQ